MCISGALITLPSYIALLSIWCNFNQMGISSYIEFSIHIWMLLFYRSFSLRKKENQAQQEVKLGGNYKA